MLWPSWDPMLWPSCVPTSESAQPASIGAERRATAKSVAFRKRVVVVIFIVSSVAVQYRVHSRKRKSDGRHDTGLTFFFFMPMNRLRAPH